MRPADGGVQIARPLRRRFGLGRFLPAAVSENPQAADPQRLSVGQRPAGQADIPGLDPLLMTLEQWERFCAGMMGLERRMGWST